MHTIPVLQQCEWNDQKNDAPSSSCIDSNHNCDSKVPGGAVACPGRGDANYASPYEPPKLGLGNQGIDAVDAEDGYELAEKVSSGRSFGWTRGQTAPGLGSHMLVQSHTVTLILNSSK